MGEYSPVSSGTSATLAGLDQSPSGRDEAIPSIDWWVTSRCNLSCDFCYGPAPAKDPAGLREAIFSAIASSSAAAVTFCGGEPLIVRGLDRYARKLADLGKKTVLNTNGQLLRQRLQQGFELAFNVVGLSVDGSTEAVHRAMRGTRADLGAVLDAARLLASTADVSLKLATVVSAVNRADLPALADLIARVKPDVWRLYEYSVRGAQNIGQHRHGLARGEFHDLAAAAAERAAPVPTRPSDENLTAGCLIVDPEGNVLQPNEDGYSVLGNCLAEPIDVIWKRATAAVTIVENKRWLSVIVK
jgi:MoaA/NifB/PqqE/SkfB family radical SAM enzyme